MYVIISKVWKVKKETKQSSHVSKISDKKKFKNNVLNSHLFICETHGKKPVTKDTRDGFSLNYQNLDTYHISTTYTFLTKRSPGS